MQHGPPGDRLSQHLRPLLEADIEDVLAAVPPERVDDVIYFDPSQMDQVIGLNMLV